MSIIPHLHLFTPLVGAKNILLYMMLTVETFALPTACLIHLCTPFALRHTWVRFSTPCAKRKQKHTLLLPLHPSKASLKPLQNMYFMPVFSRSPVTFHCPVTSYWPAYFPLICYSHIACCCHLFPSLNVALWGYACSMDLYLQVEV